MTMNEKQYESDKCIRCGLCTDTCAFLNKYGLTLADQDDLRKLSGHCFLCGDCSRICPKELDGRKIMLDFRNQDMKKANERVHDAASLLLYMEKGNYLFKNYKNAKVYFSEESKKSDLSRYRSILFPGCNFPSFYPKTTAKLMEHFAKEGIPTVFDCCGKPIEMLGLKDKSKNGVNKLIRRLQTLGIDEVVVVCPNCCQYLKEHLPFRIVTVYEKLFELYGQIELELHGKIYIPCPDRDREIFLKDINMLLGRLPDRLSGIQCCGLGGLAGNRERELLDEFASLVRKQTGEGAFYVYCASCAFSFAKKELKPVHLLCEVLDVNEDADLSNSLMNRAAFALGMKGSRK